MERLQPFSDFETRFGLGTSPPCEQGPLGPLAGGADLPPLCNTGGKLTGKLDWLTCRLPIEHFDELVSYLEAKVGEFSTSAPAKGYQKGMRGYEGTGIYWGSDRPDMSGSFVVELPGAFWSRCRGNESFDIASRLADCGGRFTRFDVAVDVASSRLMHRVWAEARRWEHVRGFRCVSLVSSRKNGRVGRSATFGRRGKLGGFKQLCVYDKAAEQEVDGPWTRWEARFYKDKAHEGMTTLLGLGMDPRAMFEAAVGVIDFREGDVGTARSRRRFWWADFLSGSNPLNVRVHRRKSSWATLCRWLETSALPSIAAAARTAGQRLNGEPLSVHALLQMFCTRINEQKTPSNSYKAFVRDILPELCWLRSKRESERTPKGSDDDLRNIIGFYQFMGSSKISPGADSFADSLVESM